MIKLKINIITRDLEFEDVIPTQDIINLFEGIKPPLTQSKRIKKRMKRTTFPNKN